MTDKEKCVQCSHQCCRWIGFSTSEMSGRSLEFYLARGCKILAADVDDRRMYRVYIPHVCGHLVEGEGCDIYDKRPLSCLEYSGSSDPLVKDVCLIKEV
jgi:hypothetical protein